MRAMNKHRRNLGIFAYPQQYRMDRQLGGSKKSFSWGELGKLAASAAGRQLADSVKKEAKDYVESGKLQKTISDLVDDSDGEEEEEEKRSLVKTKKRKKTKETKKKKTMRMTPMTRMKRK